MENNNNVNMIYQVKNLFSYSLKTCIDNKLKNELYNILDDDTNIMDNIENSLNQVLFIDYMDKIETILLKEIKDIVSNDMSLNDFFVKTFKDNMIDFTLLVLKKTSIEILDEVITNVLIKESIHFSNSQIMEISTNVMDDLINLIEKYAKNDTTTNDLTTDGSTNDLTTDGPTNDLTTDSSTNDLTTDSSTNDLTTDGSTNDLTTNGSTNDLTTDGSTNDLTTDGSTNDLTTDGSTNDLTTDGPINKTTITDNNGTIYNIYRYFKSFLFRT